MPFYPVNPTWSEMTEEERNVYRQIMVIPKSWEALREEERQERYIHDMLREATECGIPLTKEDALNILAFRKGEAELTPQQRAYYNHIKTMTWA